MDSFKTLLHKFDATLQQYNVATYENLSSPLSFEEIDKGLKELGIDDENVKALFKWKSGIEDGEFCHMIDYGGLLSFDNIKSLISLNKYYDPRLVPLISDNGEEMLLFNTKLGPHYGKLYLFSVAQLYIEYPVSIYNSLAAMLETTIELYKTGAYKYNSEDNWLDIDFDKYSPIAKKHNKDCVFWTPHDEVMWEDWYEI